MLFLFTQSDVHANLLFSVAFPAVFFVSSFTTLSLKHTSALLKLLSGGSLALHAKERLPVRTVVRNKPNTCNT